MKTATALIFATIFAHMLACSGGNSLEGTYVQESRIGADRTITVARYEFSPNGKVIVTAEMTGQAVEVDYVIEDGRLKLTGGTAGETAVMKVLADGTIEGPMGSTLRKE